MNHHPLDFIPVYGLFLIIAGITGFTLELGYRAGRRRRLRGGESESVTGTVVGSILGLLAFLLAFTFGLAATRHDSRRQAILNEANAIGTTYLRTHLLPEPQRSELAQLLREYVDVRLQRVDQRSVQEAVNRSEFLHTAMWEKAVDAANRKDTNPVLIGLFLTSLNETIDDHTVRVQAGGRERIPSVIWIGLLAIASVGFASVGYQAGLSAAKRSPILLGLVISFACVTYLIADLDRPTEGFIRVSQQVLIDARNSMKEGIGGKQ